MSVHKSAVWLTTFAFFLTPTSAEESPGLVKDRPTSGRFVKTASGFMVPYEVRIPGTSQSFWMEPVPGGKFRMGSPISESGRQSIEGPQSEWTVDPFWMGRHEVTQGAYSHYMKLYPVFKDFAYKGLAQPISEETVDAVTAPTLLYEPEFHYEYGKEPAMPMVTVTQYAAKQYTKWLSLVTESQFRLPTEAEWEYACRAGSTSAYHFGDSSSTLDEYAWFEGNSFDEGWREVGLKKPNSWGLYDMYGNVAEWVHDHCTTYKTNGLLRNAAEDWVKVDKLEPKSVRGGSWQSSAKQCRSASRLPSDMDLWRENDPDLPRSPWWLCSFEAQAVGLRVMRPLKKMTKAERDDFWEATDRETQQDVADRLHEGRGAMGRVSRKLMYAIAAERALKAKKTK